MDIEQARLAREKMEDDITAAIGRAMSEFRQATGLSPSSISIDLIEITSIDDRFDHFTVANTRASVRL